MKKAKHIFEYCAMRLFWWVLRIVPAVKAYEFGRFLGGIWYGLDRKRRCIAQENVINAKIASDEKKGKKIARAACQHFLGHLLESLRLPAQYADFSSNRIELEAPQESIDLIIKAGEPILLVSGHLGCWETALQMLPEARQTMVMVRSMNNPYVQQFLERAHFRGKIKLVSKKQGMSATTLKLWGEGRTMIMLMDQHAGRHGLWIDFFGRPASTHTSPARLHLLTGHPIICIAFVRVGLWRYRLLASEPMRFAATDDRLADQEKIIRHLSTCLESYIRAFPDQYLWMHRRWRIPPIKNKN